MSKTLNKRDSLELFIREQTLGPGINGYRFVDLEDESIICNNLKEEPSFNYSNEIIDIVPAAVYSTGILFPDEIKTDGVSSNQKEIINNETISNEGDDQEDDSQDSSEDDIESNDSIEINQQFPKTMGITCCLDEKCLKEKEIEFEISFRYYKKIKQDKGGKFNDKIGLLCEVDSKELQKFITQHEFTEYIIKHINENKFLLLSRISEEDKKVLNLKIRNIQKEIAEMLFDKISKEIFIPGLTKQKCNLSNLKSTIYYDLKNKITNDEEQKKLYEITQDIELVENITNHLKDLLNANSGGYGLWQSRHVKRIVKIETKHLDKTSKKQSLLYNKSSEGVSIHVIDENEIEKTGLKDIFLEQIGLDKEDYASLSANIQLSRDSRKNDDKIFLKIQLINTSTPFDETKHCYS